MSSATVDTPASRIGTRIADRYEVIGIIGEGAMATVYRALQLPLRRPIALKVLNASDRAYSRRLRRFVDEARILSRLRHPNTVRLLDFGRTEDGAPYIAMEEVRGGTLRDVLDGQRLSQRRALQVARQIAAALAEAHGQGVVHRDLKPENILLDTMGDDLIVRLSDFGLALDNGRDATSDAPAAARFRVGTPRYMSPEQAFCQPVDPSADLYALGALLYEMVSGHPVFRCDSKEELYFAHAYSEPESFADVAAELDVDPRVEALVTCLLAKRAEDRPASAAQVVAQLDALLHQLEPSQIMSLPAPVRAEPAAKSESIPVRPSFRSRRPTLAGAMLSAMSVAMLVAGVLV